MKTFTELKGKAAGDLIYAQDWIDLIGNIEAMDTRLQQLISDTADALRSEWRSELSIERVRIDTLETRASAIESTVADNSAAIVDLRGEVDDLRSEIEPLQQFRRVTLRTSKSRSSIGELVEMTAQVTDIRGNAIDFSSGSRPWIDFLVSWGQLKPMPGFTSQGDPGDRSIAVQVDEDGIARVRVKAEHAEEVSDEEEDEVAATLTTRMPQVSKAISDMLLDATTPMEAKNAGVFRTLSQEYDRRDSFSMRNYVDRYYVKNAPRITGRIKPLFRHRWRDYHSTVVAFLKDDNVPTTADAGRGYSSIQITFRDWITPWLQLDYLDPETLRPQIDILRGRFLPKVGNRFDESLDRFRVEVTDVLKDRGIIGRYRDLDAMNRAIDELQPSNQPNFFHNLVHSVQYGLKVQRTLLVSQMSADGDDDELLFHTISDTVGSSDAKAEVVRDDLLVEIESKVAAAETRIGAKAKQDQTAFEEALLAEDGRVRSMERFVGDVRGQLENLQEINVTAVKDGLSQIVGIGNRLSAVESRSG